MGVDKVKIAAKPGTKLDSTCRAGILERIHGLRQGTSGVFLAIVSQEIFEDLESPTNFLLGDTSQSINFAECPRRIGLSACYEYTAGNDGILRLALE